MSNSVAQINSAIVADGETLCIYSAAVLPLQDAEPNFLFSLNSFVQHGMIYRLLQTAI